ncbi:hypothetical protein Tco_0677713 [Tanacetum coccineum]|uniref:Uncharacterized protein n=1 Tax=Tanacetum coccineum TaxID=301880 RepID=A0ABQ4XD41_9ASTR
MLLLNPFYGFPYLLSSFPSIPLLFLVHISILNDPVQDTWWSPVSKSNRLASLKEIMSFPNDSQATKSSSRVYDELHRKFSSNAKLISPSYASKPFTKHGAMYRSLILSVLSFRNECVQTSFPLLPVLDTNLLETQFQMFIKSRMYLDDEFVVMTRNYFLQYTQLAIPEFRDTLIQHMESVKKSIDERAKHKEEYNSWVNERQMQTTEDKVDSSKALDASLVDTESSGTALKEQDTSSRSGNDAHADDADIRPIYDEEPMAEVQTTAEINVFAIGQQHTEQPEFNNEGEVDQNAEQCHDTCPLPATLTDNQTTELSNQSLESENIRLKKTVAQFQKDFSRMEAHCVNLELKYQNQVLKEGQHGQFSKVKSNEAKEKGFAIPALKNELRKLTGNSVNTKFAKSSILGKPALQPRRNQLVVRQPTAFKSERPRISKQRFASQVDVNNDLSKPVTTHYLPKERESAVAKPHHMIAPGSSRYSSNDMVHNHYLEEAKKKTQESCRNSEPSVMPSARSQSTANGSKPKPRINNQKSRNWPASKSSCVTTTTVPIAEHSRNSSSFSDSKHFVCSTCQKCVFNANHDSCITKFLNEVNSRAKVPSNKTTKRYIPVEQTSFAKKPERQIPKRHRSSIKKTFVVHEKTMTHRSCLRWKPTGKIFKTVGLRWVPTGKIFTSSTTKVDSKPQNGSNDDITNQYECKQTLDGFKEFSSDEQVMTSDHNSSELGIHDHSNELSSSKLVPKVVPQAEKRATSRQELELLFHHHITMLSSQAVNKSPTHYPCDSARTFRVILFSIHNDEWKSFQCHHQTALRRPYALSWKPCQGDSLNLPDHRIHKDGDGDASFQLKSDSLPHAHAQTTKTFYKHQDSRIMKAQELKTKTSAQTLIYKIFLQRYQVYQGRLLASFQDDAKYEHVGQDTRSQGGKDDQDKRIKI